MKKDIKRRILEETIRLIEERGGSTDSITIRDISAAAGVGVGLINYHYQTKERLIAACIQEIAGKVIDAFPGIYAGLTDRPPLERLRSLAKMTCAYLEANPNISRISILSDLSGEEKVENRAGVDNTSQTYAVYLPVVREICGPEAGEDAVCLKTQLLLYSLQALFLRSRTGREQLRLDFAVPEQRERLIDQVIDSLFL